MGVLKSRKETYEFSLDEIKKMIASDLEVPEEKVSVSYVQTDVSNDRMDRYPQYEVTSIKVTVDKT